MSNPRHFGPLLRHWRQHRGISQLELAGIAGVSTRHVSFLETGRAKPSREMASSLGAALDLPLAERNALHVAAGYVPPYDGGSPTLTLHVEQALAWMLRQQEPFPALVIDGHWNITARNRAAVRLFAPFRAAYAMPADIARNAIHSVFHPRGLKPFMRNWAAFAGELLLMLDREVAQGSGEAAKLRQALSAYPDFSACERAQKAGPSMAPLMTMQLQKGDLRLAFFSTFTTFAMPADATLQQVKVECFYPADEATAAVARDTACNP